jgi:hypothetical protein
MTFFIAFLLIVFPSVSYAHSFVYNFTGTVEDVTLDYNIEVGSKFVGYFFYEYNVMPYSLQELSAASSLEDINELNYLTNEWYSDATNWNFSWGRTDFSTDPYNFRYGYSIFFDGFFIENTFEWIGIGNLSTHDYLEFYDGTASTSHSIWIDDLHFRLINSYGYTFSSTALPSQLELSGFDEGRLWISNPWGNHLTAEIDTVNVNPIPEPGTMILIGIGLVVLSMVSRNKFIKL